MRPEDRTRLIMSAFGWQGGTVHDVCKEIGCNVQEFLYAEVGGVGDHDSEFGKGWSAARGLPQSITHKGGLPIDYRAGYNACRIDILKMRGNGKVQFWLGVAKAQEWLEGA